MEINIEIKTYVQENVKYLNIWAHCENANFHKIGQPGQIRHYEGPVEKFNKFFLPL